MCVYGSEHLLESLGQGLLLPRVLIEWTDLEKKSYDGRPSPPGHICLLLYLATRCFQNSSKLGSCKIWVSGLAVIFGQVSQLEKKHNQWLWSVRLTIFFEDPNCSVFTCDFLGHHCFHWNRLDDLTHHSSTIRIAIAHRVIFNYPSCFQCQKYHRRWR